MNTIKKQKSFSMKYCPELEDHVVVMTTEQDNFKNQTCLSSHLCRTESHTACGQENPFRKYASVKSEGNHFL